MFVMKQSLSRTRPGLTLIELIVVIVVVIGLLVLVAFALFPARTHRGARDIKDNTQVRWVVQSLVIFSGSNNDTYPLPSLLDRGGIDGLGNTIKSRSATEYAGKDLSRHIYSILIYQGFMPPEVLVSPAEVNGNIQVNTTYKYADPDNTVDAAQALWDPNFRAAAGDSGIASEAPGDPTNVSFAHTPPFGKRAKVWANTFDATQAVIGSRGPQYRLDSNDADASWVLTGATETKAANSATIAGGRASNTLFIHGSRNRWEGNIGYNDNSVAFHTRPDPESNPFTFTKPTTRILPDNLFVNENDEDRTPASFFGDYATPGNDNINNFLILYNNVVTNPTSEIDIKLGTWMD